MWDDGSVRSRVNSLLFGGQHDAIIKWIERLEAELERIQLPDIRYYKVTQEREVRVQANSPAEAVAAANKAFRGEEPSDNDLSVRIISPVRELDINAREDY